jgi:hypothetical protein
MSYWNGSTWVKPNAPTPRRESRATRWGATVVMFIAAGLLILPSGAASAGQSGGTSWIVLASVNGRAGSVQPSLGSSVTFDAGYPKTVKNPRIAVKCSQDGALAYAEAGTVDDSFVLGGAGSDWLRSGGAANCEADLFYFTYKSKVQTYHWLASTTFDAAG